jgi:hypothetical protein
MHTINNKLLLNKKDRITKTKDHTLANTCFFFCVYSRVQSVAIISFLFYEAPNGFIFKILVKFYINRNVDTN